MNTISIINEFYVSSTTGNWLQVQMYSRFGIKASGFANHIPILDETKNL